jgi:hypothetical protein
MVQAVVYATTAGVEAECAEILESRRRNDSNNVGTPHF